MSHSHVFTDLDGWVTGARFTEGPRPPEGDGGIAVNEEEIRAILECRPGIFYCRAGRLCAPQDDRQAWRVL